MASRLTLRVVTPRRQLVEQQVDEVRLPGALGEMGVLPGHTPLLTSLATGPLTYTDGGREQRVAVAEGFAEVMPDTVTVLAKLAELPAEIDVDQARQVAAEASAALGSANAEELDEITARLRLAETRLMVAGGLG